MVQLERRGLIRMHYLYKAKSCVEKIKKANRSCKARWTNIECLHYNVRCSFLLFGVVNCDKMYSNVL